MERLKAATARKVFTASTARCSYFGEDGIDTAHKTDMRDRILQGPPFTTGEREAILDYCEDDVRALVRFVTHIVPTIRSLPHAMLRAKFMWPIAQHERRGIPVDLPTLGRIRSRWDGIKADLVAEKNEPFGVYELVDGVPHWRKQLFADYVHATAWLGRP